MIGRAFGPEMKSRCWKSLPIAPGQQSKECGLMPRCVNRKKNSARYSIRWTKATSWPKLFFDDGGNAVDILYLEANRAAVEMAGTELVCKRASEIDTNFE